MAINDIVILGLIGLIAGVVSGALGVGGGIVLIPALALFFGMSQHMAQGTSIAILLPPTGILAAITYHKHGNINWQYAFIIMIVFVLGAWIGAKFSVSIPDKMLKKIFAVYLVLIGIKMFFGK
ncbi:sulfite exporter TauE/SafE family protein [Halosquirtibacter xylanolyticus]|uniref:sulfite exporter TauE/SafE family protein n=1 Tax=Halosquirtibacter xylanolyticus TaxID=3374599 RepID=UPI003747E607|nr:sulfite exporter TauE/SafE family protein [Prolixibacteraceae bacterium]